MSSDEQVQTEQIRAAVRIVGIQQGGVLGHDEARGRR